MIRIFSLSLLLAVTLTGCVQYVVVEPTRTTVQGALSVEPQIAWNRANNTGNPGAQGTEQGLSAEVWTIDGPLLHAVTFFAGVSDGQALARARPGSEEKLPVYKPDMTPNDVMELLEATIARVSSSPLIKSRDLRAAKLGGQDGFRFELTYTLKDEVEREATAVGAIRNGKLYMILYQGTKLFHYGKYLPQVERMIDSAKFL